MQELTVTQAFDAAEVQLIQMWLHERPETTRYAYLRDIEMLYRFIAPRGLRSLTLLDLQMFSDSLAGSAVASRARRLSSAKSLLSFMHREGFLPVNVGAALRLPKVRNKLAQRILTEEQVVRMLALEDSRRNHAILSLLYHGGLRVSELCSLTWRDVQPNRDAGQVTITGKGDKTRSVPLKAETYQEILALRPAGADQGAPVFISEGRVRGIKLSRIHVFRIVEQAARRAGLAEHVSPHWLRHAHASHSIDRGAPLPLVRDTLGHSSIAVTDKYAHARPGESSAHYLAV
jgi:integrase/recombinase XerD